jgi:hypothetical protein
MDQALVLADFMIKTRKDEAESPYTRFPGMHYEKHCQGLLHISYTRRGKDLWKYRETGKSLMFLLGEIYDYENCNSMEAFEKIGDDFDNNHLDAGNINGQFNLVFFSRGADGNICRITFLSDIMGIQHAFIFTGGKEILIASSYKQILDLLRSRNMNRQAVSRFARMGFFPGTDTWFKEIQIIPPATCLQFVKKGDYWIKESGNLYWNWNYRPANLSFEKKLNEYHELLQTAVRRRLIPSEDQISLALSGGLDSRNIAGTVRNTRVKTYAYAYNKNSEELSISRHIARKCGLAYCSYVIPSNILERMDFGTRLLEGYQDIFQARQLLVIDRLAQQNTSYLLAGHWGDVWHDSLNLQSTAMAHEELAEITLQKFSKKGHEMLLRALGFTEEEQKECKKDLLAFFAAEYEKIPVKDVNFKYKALKTWQWSFRWTNASLRAFYPAFYPRLPFHDNDLIRLYQSLPESYVFDRKLQIAWFRKFAPDLASVRWQEIHTSLRYSRKQARYFSIPYRFINKVLRFAGIYEHIERNADLQLLDKPDILNTFVCEQMLKGSWIEKSGWEYLFRKWREKPDAGNTYAVSMMLSMLAASKYFNDQIVS